jgi:hypothetical protein
MWGNGRVCLKMNEMTILLRQVPPNEADPYGAALGMGRVGWESADGASEQFAKGVAKCKTLQKNKVRCVGM